MTRARHVTPSATAERLERMRTLITALQVSDLSRDEIGSLLKVGPSGVRKYLVDLVGVVARVAIIEMPMYRLTLGPQQAAEYLATLAIQAAARPKAERMSDLDRARRDRSRQFHILSDDTHFAIRLHCGPATRDALVVALFGPANALSARPTEQTVR